MGGDGIDMEGIGGAVEGVGFGSEAEGLGAGLGNNHIRRVWLWNS